MNSRVTARKHILLHKSRFNWRRAAPCLKQQTDSLLHWYARFKALWFSWRFLELILPIESRDIFQWIAWWGAPCLKIASSCFMSKLLVQHCKREQSDERKEMECNSMTAMCQTFLTGRIKKGIRQNVIFQYFLATRSMLHHSHCESLQPTFKLASRCSYR